VICNRKKYLSSSVFEVEDHKRFLVLGLITTTCTTYNNNTNTSVGYLKFLLVSEKTNEMFHSE